MTQERDLTPHNKKEMNGASQKGDRLAIDGDGALLGLRCHGRWQLLARWWRRQWAVLGALANDQDVRRLPLRWRRRRIGLDLWRWSRRGGRRRIDGRRLYRVAYRLSRNRRRLLQLAHRNGRGAGEAARAGGARGETQSRRCAVQGLCGDRGSCALCGGNVS